MINRPASWRVPSPKQIEKMAVSVGTKAAPAPDQDIALHIREKSQAETGLSASAGISYNKFLAKLASRKPNGQFVISPEMGSAFVERLRVGKFHGNRWRDASSCEADKG
jgi:nucleotidyltransferase/DNA polymerase involved in DNA repair